MTYEKDIPDYAMVPARETEEKVIVPVTGGAIYSPVQVTDMTEDRSVLITLEEDILVPDTKPDLREILLIDGRPYLSFRETDQIAAGDDYINISGELLIQTLYLPEKPAGGCPLTSVSTKLPFREQWRTELIPGACLTAECRLEKIEHMVVNERKFRIKASVRVTARQYKDLKADVFEGIIDEDLQMLKEEAEISSIALRKKDSLSVKEDIFPKDDIRPGAILKQDLYAVENYRQAAGDKVVINGSVYVSLLYSGADENYVSSVIPDGEDGDLSDSENSAAAEDQDLSRNICQLTDRIEFTQFIPLPQAGNFSGVDVFFDDSRLSVKPAQNEDGKDVFRVEGELLTYADLYRNSTREFITDCYHREKDFVCSFDETKCKTLAGISTGESSVREIISVDGEKDAGHILYTSADISCVESAAEQGKLISEGSISVNMICASSGQESSSRRLFVQKGSVPFRVVTAAPQLKGTEIIRQKAFLKDVWAEKINSKQLEFNATVLICAQIFRPVSLKILKNPAFETGSGASSCPSMAIYICRKGDSLWDIAKRFKTTAESIRVINDLGDDFSGESLREGLKLLIVK